MISQIKVGTYKQKKQGSRKKRVLQLGIILSAFGIVLGGFMHIFNEQVLNCEGDNCFIPVSHGTLKDPELAQDNQRTNILIAGIDTRESGNLLNTDTIILAQIDYTVNKIFLISIPRDLWVSYQLPNGGYVSSKVNSVYATGEINQDVDDGMELLKQVVSDITGEPIHYHTLVTLKGFEEAIDIVGGIEVDVPNGWDGLYPIPTGWESIHFDEGYQTMDGERALKYARTRNVPNSTEGSDFARARRQQIVIEATLQKIISTETLLNPSKIYELYNTLSENIKVSKFNNPMDIKAAISLKDKIDVSNTINIVLDPMLGGEINRYIYTANMNPSRGYTIEARDQTYGEIQEYLEIVRQYPDIYEEQPTIVIYNATGEAYLDEDYSVDLENDNPLIKVHSANQYLDNTSGDYSGITIYDFTENNDNPATSEFLKRFFQVSDISIDMTQAPGRLFGEDFAIVIAKETTQISD